MTRDIPSSEAGAAGAGVPAEAEAAGAAVPAEAGAAVPAGAEAAGGGGQRGRPRAQEADRAILNATVDLLGGGGGGGHSGWGGGAARTAAAPGGGPRDPDRHGGPAGVAGAGRHVDRGGRGAGRSGQGDDLPALVVQGAAGAGRVRHVVPGTAAAAGHRDAAR